MIHKIFCLLQRAFPQHLHFNQTLCSFAHCSPDVLSLSLLQATLLSLALSPALALALVLALLLLLLAGAIAVGYGYAGV